MKSLVALGLVLLSTASAHAEKQLPYRLPPGTGKTIVIPDPNPVASVGNVSKIIFLERCKGGCTVRKGVNDSRGYTSSIPSGSATEFFLDEFQNEDGEVGAAADAEWNALVKCVQEVYSPFDVVVTDVKPTAPTYHMDIVAGLARDVGLSPNILGVSPGVSCTPADNYITYTFANAYGGSGVARTWELCATVAQETAHSFGLDHSYAFGNRSACIDPMTYRGDCGGQRFFRNDQATCGEYSPQPCSCGATQNAHLALLNVFGPGTPISTPPTLTVKTPMTGATVNNGFTVLATAGAQRGIASVELWLNGYKWASAVGAQWTPTGQPTTDYGLTFPADVPDGVIDIVVKAKDDIEVTTESPVITVTKGAPCTSADSCANGQQCEAGKCFWAPPVGKIGDECTYPQYCESGLCSGTAETQICTRSCVVGVGDSCDDGFVCIATSSTLGVCFPMEEHDGGGCAASPGTPPVAGIALSLLGFTVLVGRRRRRAA